tara:strand:+ start:53 stop:721 length:669 start_codon:yes stop_codon:yes gene_type:complete
MTNRQKIVKAMQEKKSKGGDKGGDKAADTGGGSTDRSTIKPKSITGRISEARTRISKIGESAKIPEIEKKKSEKKKKKNKSLLGGAIDAVKGALSSKKGGRGRTSSKMEQRRRARKGGSSVREQATGKGKGKGKKKTSELTHKQKVAAEVKRLESGGKPFQSRVDKSDWTAEDYAEDYQGKADRKAKIESGVGSKKSKRTYMTGIRDFEKRAKKLRELGKIN